MYTNTYRYVMKEVSCMNVFLLTLRAKHNMNSDEKTETVLFPA